MLCATLLASTLLTGFYQKFTELRPNVHDFTEEFKQNLVEPHTPSKTEVYSNRLAFSQSLFDALHRDPNVNFHRVARGICLFRVVGGISLVSMPLPAGTQNLLPSLAGKQTSTVCLLTTLRIFRAWPTIFVEKKLIEEIIVTATLKTLTIGPHSQMVCTTPNGRA